MTRPVGPTGPESARILIVGEAPGKDEVIEGRPFVGAAGRLLRRKLFDNGIDPDSVWLTNLSKHQPPGNELKHWYTGKTPSHGQLILDIMELRGEIERVNPDVILALGNYPTDALTGVLKYNDDAKIRAISGIGDWRGSILEGNDTLAGGRKVVASYHPSAIVRGQWADAHLLSADIARTLAQSAFPEIRRPQRELIIDPRGPERSRIKDRLLWEGSYVTFDIEYSRTSKRLWCVGLSSGLDWACTIVIRSPADLAFVKEILCSSRPLCGQNVIFDAAILEWHYNIPCLQYVVHDTMIAAHAAYVDYPKDLGFLCRMYTEQPNYWAHFDNAFWTALSKDKRKIEEILEYNCIDVWVTANVAHCQIAEDLVDPNFMETFKHEMALLPVLWRISKRGVKVSRERMEAISKSAEAEADIAQSLLDTLNGGPLNVKSGPQMSDFLVRMGIPLRQRTDGGNWFKNDDVTLSNLMPQLDGPTQGVVRAVKAVRTNRDLRSKFTDVEYDADGRMRSHYTPSTETGRLASKKFFPTGLGVQGQNVSTDKRVRSCFIADSGFEFAYADLERAESLVVSHISGDPFMLEIHRPGVDAHIATAALIYDRPYEELIELYRMADEHVSRMREMGKQGNHALNYMMGWSTFMKRVNAKAHKTGIYITAAESKVIVAKVRASRPLVVSWWDDVKQTVSFPPHTTYNLLGRKRVWYAGPYANLPDAVAWIPQSTVGDALNYGLRALDADEELRRMEWQGLLQVHDAVGFQYPRELRDLVLPRIRRLMDVPLHYDRRDGPVDFSIPIEIKIGPSWGELELWTEDLVEAA